MINLLYSLVGEPLSIWVTQQVAQHRQRQQEEACVELDPQVHEAYQRSTAISCKFLY